MKILVNGIAGDVLVEVSKDRKCAASIDIISITEAPYRLARLSFGDSGNPDTDVEIDFTFEQLMELMQTVMLGYNKLETELAEYNRLEEEKAKEKEKKKHQRQVAHYGSC